MRGHDGYCVYSFVLILISFAAAAAAAPAAAIILLRCADERKGAAQPRWCVIGC